MTAKQKINKAQKEKILYAVFVAMGRKAHEETIKDVERAFSQTFAEFYTKVFGKTGTEADKAFHALAKKGLIQAKTAVNIQSVLPDVKEGEGWSAIKKDAGLSAFSSATQALPGQGSGYLGGKYIAHRGMRMIESAMTIKLDRQYPSILLSKIQYAGDEFKPLRDRFVNRMVQALDIYKTYAEAAIQVRAVVMNAKSPEDLKADLPDIADVVDSVIAKPIALPAAISPELTNTLSKLKPIEVTK